MTLDATRPACDARSPNPELVALVRLNAAPLTAARGTEGATRMDLVIVLCVIGEWVLSANYMQAGTASGVLLSGEPDPAVVSPIEAKVALGLVTRNLPQGLDIRHEMRLIRSA
jgi:hypothetical protein